MRTVMPQNSCHDEEQKKRKVEKKNEQTNEY